MSCDRYTDAIVDHACGAEIAADAAAHLRSCAACRRMFDEQRQTLQDLDRELETALAIEPSDRFVAETMARVERSSPRWRTAIWWSVPAAAAAAVLILVALGALRFGERKPTDRREPGLLKPRRRLSPTARLRALRRPLVPPAHRCCLPRGPAADAPGAYASAEVAFRPTFWCPPHNRRRLNGI